MKTLILIPAFGCDGRLYEPQIAALKSSINCITRIGEGDRYEAMVEKLLAEAPEQFAVLGTSMGGRLALEVTLAAPERVEALCVIGAAAGAVADKAAGFKRSERIRSGEKDSVLREMGDIISQLDGPNGPAVREAFIAMGRDFDTEALIGQSDALAYRDDKWARVGEISCPSLFLWGVKDQFSPAADGARLAEMVQDGSYVELPDCGHFPTLEYPEKANAAIVAWLEDAGLI
jgi:pimeloyl-ACP methyl ester carboxylesterase